MYIDVEFAVCMQMLKKKNNLKTKMESHIPTEYELGANL